MANENKSVMDQALCLIVRFGGFGLTRKASMGAVTVNAEKKMLALSKRLLRSKAYDAIKSHEREIKSYLQRVALPSLLTGGSYLVADPLVADVEVKLQQARTRRLELIDAFLAEYPEIVAAVGADLRDLYNPKDYPSIEALRSCYRFEWQYVGYGVPGRLQSISASLFASERDKAAAKLGEASDEIKTVLRAGFAELIAKLTRALTPSSDGKRRVLKTATVENLREFLTIFDMRNIADDQELAAQVAKARSLMQGIDPEILRSDANAKQAIANGFTAIEASLQTMAVERGTRAISFEDEA